MRPAVFQIVTLVKPSFFQRLFKQYPQENAVIELNNLLASKPIEDIKPNDIATIQGRYKINLAKEFKLNLEEFYTVYLNHCLADKVLNTQELAELQILKQLLGLDDPTISKLHTKLGAVIYQQSFQEAVADGRLTQKKKDLLKELETTLQLPAALVKKISAETRTAFVQNYVDGIIADQQLSPAEEAELEAISKSLNVTNEIDAQSQEQLRKLKLYWALENLELPVVQTEMLLQKAEVCHLIIPSVNWYELRSVRQRIGSVGYSTSFKIAKGFYLRASRSQSQSYSVDQTKLIDTGTLYLTNKRILFTGAKKNSNIQLGKIIEMIPYKDGVEIGKETGKSPTLQMKTNVDIFCLMLERLLRER